jgi:hypothetical protein
MDGALEVDGLAAGTAQGKLKPHCKRGHVAGRENGID